MSLILSDRFETTSDFLVWQLIDSAFPAGGFAHSGGIEAAWQHGEIRNATDFSAITPRALEQAACTGIPFLIAAHEAPENFEAIDHHCDCFLTNHVANRASRAQGKALQSSAARIFPVGAPSPNAYNHFAPTFGLLTHKLGVSRGTAIRMFLFMQLRALVSSAVRLGIIGPIEGQRFQHAQSDLLETLAQRCGDLSLDDATQTSPLLEIWQGSQDRLYSRLFQS